MDKAITNVMLLMTRGDLDFPVYRLPENYTFCMYRDGLEHDWARIETAVGEFPDEGSALAYFSREFLPFKDELQRRMIFVCDENARPVGTITAWYGDTFAHITSRVHWFAIEPEAWGKGLARPLLSKCMEVFRELTGDTACYLSVKTWSYRAIRLYMQYGFSPYFGACPAKWNFPSEEFEKNNHLGWMIVNGKILELLINKPKD